MMTSQFKWSAVLVAFVLTVLIAQSDTHNTSADEPPADESAVESTSDAAGGQPAAFRNAAINLFATAQTKPSPTWAAEFSPDSTTVAVANGKWGVEGTLTLWDVRKRQAVWARRHARGLRRIAFSPDGSQIATVSYDGYLAIHDAKTGDVTFHHHFIDGHAYALDWSPDGKTLATGGRDGNVHLWDAGADEPRAKFQAHPGGVYCVSFAGNDQLYTAGQDKLAKRWNLKSREVEIQFAGHGRAIEMVVLSPDGRRVATCGPDKTVRLWDIDGTPGHTLEGHDASVLSIEFSPDGRTLLSGSGVWSGQKQGTGELRMWDVETGKEIATFDSHDAADKLFALAWSPDGRWWVSGGWLEANVLWDAKTRHPVGQLDRFSYSSDPQVVLDAAVSRDGSTVAVAHEGGVRLLDATSGVLRRELPGFDDVVSCVAFSPDGHTLAAGGYDRQIKLWNAATGEETVTLKGHTNWIFSIAFSPDGKTLASGGYDKVVRLWDVAAGKQQRVLSGHGAAVRAVAFSPDGKRVVSGSTDRTIRLWNVDGELQSTWTGHNSAIRAIAFSPDGKTVASGSEDKTVRLWDVAAAKQLRVLEGHTDMVWSVAFDPQHDAVVSGGFDNAIRYWDVRTGRIISELKRHTNVVSALVFAPDGDFLISGSHDKSLKRWNRTE